MDELQAWETLQKALQYQKEERLNQIVDQVHKALYYSRDNNLNTIYFQLASILHYYYYIIRRDIRTARRIDKELSKAKTLRDIEEKIRLDYIPLNYQLQSSRNVSASIRQQLNQYCENYTHHLELKNLNISLYIYPLLITKLYLDKNYIAVVNNCQKAITFFDKKEKQQRPTFSFTDDACTDTLQGLPQSRKNHPAVNETKSWPKI